MLFFALTGFLLFQIFGFSIGAFRIAGGVLLFTTAVSMLNPRPTAVVSTEASQDIALMPLSLPFTCGPGTIVTIIILMTEARNIWGTTAVLPGLLSISGVFIGMAVTLAVSYYMMSKSETIDARLGESGRRVITRLMGLIVMAIAIQFIINGVKDLLPEFAEIWTESVGGGNITAIFSLVIPGFG
jgi:multiple antibiotic resistance protein